MSKKKSQERLETIIIKIQHIKICGIQFKLYLWGNLLHEMMYFTNKTWSKFLL